MCSTSKACAEIFSRQNNSEQRYIHTQIPFPGYNTLCSKERRNMETRSKTLCDQSSYGVGRSEKRNACKNTVLCTKREDVAVRLVTQRADSDLSFWKRKSLSVLRLYLVYLSMRFNPQRPSFDAHPPNPVLLRLLF